MKTIGAILGAILGMHLAIAVVGPIPLPMSSTCNPLLSAPLKYGDQNNNVTLLQLFLLGQGEEIPAGATGYYGAQTRAAVESFQLRYAFQILYPLHLSGPTGAVYSATLAQINALWCSAQ